MSQYLCLASARAKKNKLEQGNIRFHSEKETDWLTGLYNREAMAQRITAYIRKGLSGTMIMLDLDHFKQVNDRYGHMAGDRLLQSVAAVLKKMAGSNSLVGRVGGDEFLIFISSDMPQEELMGRCRRIRERFQHVYLSQSTLIHLSLTVSGVTSTGFKRYEDMYDCVCRKVREIKRSEKQEKERGNGPVRRKPELVEPDMSLIADDLGEDDRGPGAYCQDYETFKQVYRLTERRLRREIRGVFLILFTLTDQDKGFLDMERQTREMERLGDGIRKSLRMGDLYTRYSSCQYLVMVSDINEEEAVMIARRISDVYYGGQENDGSVILRCSYPLKPEDKGWSV
ncbi:GGDEF domain-containing protein [Enterocloster citroniae]|uniref:GGDEF domain-containing protein n=1 Tax=Enterocloster citroniae TaxID=358743 RepID=UPI0032BFDCF8